ncbi:MAG: nuclear transport factor 2 family protein [Myxococcota bacterium]
MNSRLVLLSLVTLATVSGCRGPKGSPEGSVKSFYNAVVAEDWDAMVDTVSQDSLKRIGSREKAAAVFARDFSGWKEVELTIDDSIIDASGDKATVRFECISTQLQNYKPRQYDCSDTFALAKESDGKWHIHLPGGARLRPM